MEIRSFQKDDRARVEAFFKALDGEAKFFFNRKDWNFRDALKFFDSADDSDNVRWMAVDTDGRMAGYVFLTEAGTMIPLLGICIAEFARGRGLGGTLMKTAEDWARQNRKGGIILTTHVANIKGQALYEKSGYRRYGVHTSGEYLYLLRF